MAAKLKPVSSTPPQIIRKADTLVLSLAADKEGRIRTNCAGFDNPVVVLPGGKLEVHWKDGQVVLWLHAPKRK